MEKGTLSRIHTAAARQALTEEVAWLASVAEELRLPPNRLAAAYAAHGSGSSEFPAAGGGS